MAFHNLYEMPNRHFFATDMSILEALVGGRGTVRSIYLQIEMFKACLDHVDNASAEAFLKKTVH